MIGADRFDDTADYWHEVTYRIKLNYLQVLTRYLVDQLAVWNLLEDTVYDQTG